MKDQPFVKWGDMLPACHLVLHFIYTVFYGVEGFSFNLWGQNFISDIILKISFTIQILS